MEATTVAATARNTTIDFGKSVVDLVGNSEFCKQHKNKMAPIAIVAMAKEVETKVIGSRDQQLFDTCFDGLTMTTPQSESSNQNPHHHSIVGQKLLFVDWIRTCGIAVPCPDSRCSGTLKNDRTQFSKSKTLFPTFGLDGPPSWCMVQKMECRQCHRDFWANEPAVLLTLPAHIAQLCPVETKCALPNHSFHISREATGALDSLMLTHANGELCSRLLCTAINQAYLRRVTACCSYKKANKTNEPVAPHVAKDGVFIKEFPPLGDTTRNMCDEACNTKDNPWQVSDHDRHTREIQSVKCSGIFAQDHTFEAIKNYQKSLGAKAAWDVATSTGEIATAVCVPTTKTRHFSHAAKMLLQRPDFEASFMCSDTWPHKKEHWENLVDGLTGRLGLFHFEKRILSALRKKHVDFHDAVSDLLAALYEFESQDYEKLLTALKNGTLSTIGKQHTTTEIAQLQQTKYFRKNYAKHLRKKMREPNTMVQRLDDWFCKYKVTSSDQNSRPARGRLDPRHNMPLFTPETKPAVENCKEKAIHLADPFNVEDMYDKTPPNPNSKHQLTECMSKRGESKLESFHDRLANFANSGMRNSLSDNLHLAGTARCNMAMRYKRRLLTLENPSERSNMPAAWERICPYWNQLELLYINQMAIDVGGTPPFPAAETLPEDDGERFFSECITNVNPLAGKYGLVFDDCLCNVCTTDKVGDESAPAATARLSKPPARPAISDRPEPVTVRQQQQPQQLVNNVAPTPQTQQPRITQQSFQLQQQPTWMHFPILPMPMHFMPPVMACCTKHHKWMEKRKGRPPHDYHCQNRGAKNSSNSSCWSTNPLQAGVGENGKGKNNFTI